MRLGHVARRLLRRADSPIVIVPPDLVAADVGGGAVVALTALADDSLAACRFAAALAARASRALTVAHVARDPDVDLPDYLFRSVHRPTASDVVAAGRDRLSRWLDAHAIRPAIATVLQGDVLMSVLELADAQRAPLVVVGARPRSALERTFSASLGRDLAAFSDVPIAVVPPTMTSAEAQM